MTGTGFDAAKYLKEQTATILERLRRFDSKLYLEFGGKLLFDYHASRVLPGFEPNVKMKLLQQLRNDADIVLCIHAGAIERKKMRADFGITYDSDAMKLIDDLREDWGIEVLAVVITRFEEGPAGATQFRNKLERRGIRVYTHTRTRGYPTDVDQIVSDEGYGANEYIETRNPLVVVTGPGPGSGKLATCLSQMYHDHRRGLKSGYAKFETFPIWNLPLKHPVNVAYEAATADLRDVNMIDPFHLEAHGETAINYNRDIEAFPLLKRILEKITGAEAIYGSPTDMGVNRAGYAIHNDHVVANAAKQEIIRRHFRYGCEYALGLVDKGTVERAELIMKELDLQVADRSVVMPAREAAEQAARERKGHDGVCCGAAIELPGSDIVVGKNSPLMHASAAAVFNAIKQLAAIPDKIDLITPGVIKSIGLLKKEVFDRRTVSLDLEEALIALSTSCTANSATQLAMEQLKNLRGCEMHMTHIPTRGDEAGLRKLGVNLTSDPVFATDSLFIT